MKSRKSRRRRSRSRTNRKSRRRRKSRSRSRKNWKSRRRRTRNRKTRKSRRSKSRSEEGGRQGMGTYRKLMRIPVYETSAALNRKYIIICRLCV